MTPKRAAREVLKTLESMAKEGGNQLNPEETHTFSVSRGRIVIKDLNGKVVCKLVLVGA